MTIPPDPQNPAPLLDYNAPKRGDAKSGCLILAILLAVAVGGLCCLAFLFMLGDNTILATLLVGGLVALVVAAIIAKKYGLSAALAITLASVCAFLLMLGICSQFTLNLH